MRLPELSSEIWVPEMVTAGLPAFSVVPRIDTADGRMMATAPFGSVVADAVIVLGSW